VASCDALRLHKKKVKGFRMHPGQDILGHELAIEA
jgi:hypothetical protein